VTEILLSRIKLAVMEDESGE